MTMVEASVIPIEMKTTPSTAQMKPRRDAKTLGAAAMYSLTDSDVL